MNRVFVLTPVGRRWIFNILFPQDEGQSTDRESPNVCVSRRQNLCYRNLHRAGHSHDHQQRHGWGRWQVKTSTILNLLDKNIHWTLNGLFIIYIRCSRNLFLMLCMTRYVQRVMYEKLNTTRYVRCIALTVTNFPKISCSRYECWTSEDGETPILLSAYEVTTTSGVNSIDRPPAFVYKSYEEENNEVDIESGMGEVILFGLMILGKITLNEPRGLYYWWKCPCDIVSI